MKAAQINQYGGSNIVAVNEVAIPTPKADCVLVEVHSASLNPFDTKLREGYMKEGIPLEFPFTLGGDIAGIVTQLGQNVTNFNLGDNIYGQANGVSGNSGAFAEFASTKSTAIARMPSNVDFEQAASLVLVGVSACQALVKHINLQAGQKLFIHGGAGGIGSVAIQIAKHLGAHIATTATGQGLNYATKIGADQVIDYKSQEFNTILKDFDAVFDTVGGQDFDKTLLVLKKGGIGVSMAGQASEATVNELGVAAISQMTHVDTAALDTLRELIEAGIVTPHVGPVFPLAQVQEAFEVREQGAEGKVILSITQ